MVNSNRWMKPAQAAEQKVSAALEKTMDLPIASIRPDPEQPRRVVPAQYRTLPFPQVLNIWWKAEMGNAEPRDFIDRAAGDMIGTSEGDEDNTPDSSIVGLMLLAASIKAKGLINPITVAAIGPERYQIETGERRWWAHRILMGLYPDEWQMIRATIKPQIDRWRQAEENNSRDDLNAIGKARQLAILLMELHKENGTSFLPRDHSDHERDYYVQVANLQAPPGTSERLLKGMGFANRGQLSRYRKVLALSPEKWDAADAKNWSLETILDIVEPPKKEDVASSNNRPAVAQKRTKKAKYLWVADALQKAQDATTPLRRAEWIAKAEKGIEEMIVELKNLKGQS